MVCSPGITHVSIRRIIMGLNKSKKLSKKSIKPTKVEELEDDVEELEDDVEELEDDVEELEDDDVEELEDDVEEPVKKARKSMGAKKAKVDADEDDEDDEDEEVTFDTDAVVNGIMTDKKSLTSAVYQVQLRLPADIEPMYKGLTPKLKKALRDAFGELIRKAYAQTH